MRKAWLLEYSLPLAAPFSFAGHELDRRRGFILHLADGAHEGYGEAAPLPGFSTESLSQVRRELSSLINHWCQPSTVQAGAGLGCSDLDQLAPSTAFAWSLAQHELAEGSLQPTIALPTALLLGADLAGLDAEIADGVRAEPAARVAKVKVGRGALLEDIQRLQLIMQRLPGFQLRLDGNRCWSLSQVLELHSALPGLPVAFLEEPLRDPSELATMASVTGWGYALDETLQSPDFNFTPAQGLVALVLKPSLFGSLQRCNALVQAANSAHLELVVSSSFESSLGNTQLRALAEHWSPETAPGLDTLKHFKLHAWQQEQLANVKVAVQAGNRDPLLRCIESWTGEPGL